MKIAIAASLAQKEILVNKGFPADAVLFWADDSQVLELLDEQDLYIDCTLDNTTAISSKRPLLLHSPIATLQESGGEIARFCAWPGFLERPLWEIAVADLATVNWFENLGWPYRIIQDVPGLIAPRVIAGIINEAYFTWQEGISSQAEIDTAMKLGTNYPYGPFEWANKIGIENVADLLISLGQQNPMYEPCTALLEQAKKEKTQHRINIKNYKQ